MNAAAKNNSEVQRTGIGLMTLSDREFKLISNLVYDRWGIKLGEQKKSLIAGRLQKILKQNNLKNFVEYYDFVTNDTTGESLDVLIDRISTNHTFFYRENDHFKYFLEQALPDVVSQLQARGSRDLRIWVPGCSSGEEPYTLAMLLHEYFGNDIKLWDIGILATDISTTALQRAIAGIYTSENVSKMPNHLTRKYFESASNGQLSIIKSVRDLILYRRLNLILESYPFKGKFQMIFCRNVMIYFDSATRENLVNRFFRYSDQEAYLFIGHSETLGRSNSKFKYIYPAVYRKVN